MDKIGYQNIIRKNLFDNKKLFFVVDESMDSNYVNELDNYRENNLIYEQKKDQKNQHIFYNPKFQMFTKALKIKFEIINACDFLAKYPSLKNQKYGAVFIVENDKLPKLFIERKFIKGETKKSLVKFLYILNHKLFDELCHDEIYDVFDEYGKQVSMATWKDCHYFGLLHQTVAILIFKDKTRHDFLIQKRSKSMGHEPLTFSHSCGGHISPQMGVLEGIKMELQEELFFKHKLPKFPIKKIATIRVSKDVANNQEILHIFEGVYKGPFFYNPAELAESPKWVNFDELIWDMRKNSKKYMTVFHPIMSELIKYMKK